MRAWSALIVLLAAVDSLAAQSRIGIGRFLEPWGVSERDLVTMTPDGNTVFWVEAIGSNGCGASAGSTRISSIRTDGTDYRVILSSDVLSAHSPSSFTFPDDLRVSGDGKWLAFAWYDAVVNPCQGAGAYRWYLVEVESGQVSEFLHNGSSVGCLSFSDDGSTLCYVGFDPVADSWGFYLAEPDGANPALALDISSWFAVIGMISPDGTKIVFVGWDPASLGDVFVFDLQARTLARVSPFSAPWIFCVSSNDDASRVVYVPLGGPVYAVSGDGTDFHTVSTGNVGSSGTVTRDGEHVFFLSLDEGSDVRVDWDGSNKQIMGGWSATLFHNMHRAVSFDGSIYAGAGVDMTCPDCTVPSLAVWYANAPVLTAYGYGTTGTQLTWDVGSKPGDTFVIGTARPRGPLVGAVAALGLGEIALMDSLGFGQLSGTVMGPDNVGTVEVLLPPTLANFGPIEVDFQATVFDAEGLSPPKKTNVARMELNVTPAQQVVAGDHARGSQGERRHHGSLVSRRPQPPGPVDLTHDEVLWLMAQRLPQLRWHAERGDIELVPPQRSLSFR